MQVRVVQKWQNSQSQKSILTLEWKKHLKIKVDWALYGD
jgi:hypothetical protein